MEKELVSEIAEKNELVEYLESGLNEKRAHCEAQGKKIIVLQDKNIKLSQRIESMESELKMKQQSLEKHISELRDKKGQLKDAENGLRKSEKEKTRMEFQYSEAEQCFEIKL